MSRAGAFVLAAALATCASCSSEPSDDDIDQAYETAQDQLSGATFQDVGDTSDCTDDCGGHDAGFDWAKEEGVTDPSECSGDSQSFVEGCETYAATLETLAEDELDSEE
ncbi:hypothetical protein GCM10023325_08730 [Sphingomonas lutea]